MLVSSPISAKSPDGRRRSGVSILLALGLALAACSAPPVRQADVPNYGEIKVLFDLGQDVQVINVRALDRLPITAATLVLATGERVPAYSIDQIANPTFTNTITLGAPQSDIASIGGGPPALAGSGRPENKTTLIGQIASVGLIRVPDLPSYRQDWQSAKIEVHMGLAPDDRVEILAAPQPG
ncbi:MAG: hypothetical protein WDN69_03060 [Aliidongia sp.]